MADRLDEILISFEVCLFNAECDKESRQCTNRAKKELIDIFMECVPESSGKDSYPIDFSGGINLGVDQCRAETIKNIEKLKGDSK